MKFETVQQAQDPKGVDLVDLTASWAIECWELEDTRVIATGCVMAEVLLMILS